ncbi:hypothetical protein DFA_04082 [Cavenderia fasciculata]|uniref:Transmembrane protein n=1 Tax=Cavenderia fasciculata TaxID=261658 RepID=F4Q187_CACFS|nr:uncharacterized protein DFA_04082 [Cavenderia fasciculata]EGG18588.1 hypothetical protein DFA_04082 [Cavenderia fasciculata]|eukprot:XP_004366492.1 hypothetical protein DFA_04082 [Cavenderia fasciculata]
MNILKYLLFILIIVFVNGNKVEWLSNAPTNYFQDPQNWDSSITPTSTDDVVVGFNNSFIMVQNSQTVQSFQFLNTTGNNTMEIGNSGALSISNTLTIQNGKLSIASSTPSSIPSLTCSQNSLLLKSKVDLLSFASASFNYINVTDSIINLNSNGSQTLKSNATYILRSKVNQQDSCNSRLTNVISFTGSDINSNNSKLFIDNTEFVNQHFGVRTTNITLSSTILNSNNNYIYGNSNLTLKSKSKLNANNVTFVSDSALLVDDSTLTFNGTFYSISSRPMAFRNGAIIQSQSPSKVIFGFSSRTFFENTMFDINGEIIAQDSAILYFSQVNKLKRPMYITLRDNAKIVIVNSSPALNSVLDILKQIVAMLGETHLEASENQQQEEHTTTTTSLPANSIQPTDPDVFTQIDLHDNSRLELEDAHLDGVIINTNRLSQVVIKNNVVLSNSQVNTVDSVMVINTDVLLNNTALSLDNATVLVTAGGSLGGTGQIIGGVLVNATGQLGSNDVITRLSISKSVTGGKDDSHLAIRINSPTDYSQINISMDYDFYGTVQVYLSPEAAIKTGYTYTLVNYLGGKIVFSPDSMGVTQYTLLDGGRTVPKLPSNRISDQNIMIISVVVSIAFIGIIAGGLVYLRRRREINNNKKADEEKEKEKDFESKPTMNQLRTSNSHVNIKLSQFN